MNNTIFRAHHSEEKLRVSIPVLYSFRIWWHPWIHIANASLIVRVPLHVDCDHFQKDIRELFFQFLILMENPNLTDVRGQKHAWHWAQGGASFNHWAVRKTRALTRHATRTWKIHSTRTFPVLIVNQANNHVWNTAVQQKWIRKGTHNTSSENTYHILIDTRVGVSKRNKVWIKGLSSFLVYRPCLSLYVVRHV